MVGVVIGVVVEGLTGFGIAHQIGLGALVDGNYLLPHPISALLFLNFCSLISVSKFLNTISAPTEGNQRPSQCWTAFK